MVVSDFIQIGLLLVLIGQLYINIKVFRADHERKKKQATFEFVNAVSDRYKSSLAAFNEKHGGKIIDISNYDEEDRKFVRGYLSEIERICAGVNAKVFDFEMLQKMMHTSLIKSNNKFRQFIDERQGTSKTIYQEFDEVVRKLKEKSMERYENIGQMRHG